MGKEKIEKMPIPEEELKEKKEQAEEIQRLELDPNEGIDIVIKKSPKARMSQYSPFRIRLVLERDGKTLEDFQNEAPDIKFYAQKSAKEGWYYMHRFKKVIVPEKWKSNKNILSFLHELGHGLYYIKYPEEYGKKMDSLASKADAEFKLFTIKKRGGIWRKEKPDEIPALEHLTEKEKNIYIDNLKETVQEFASLNARAERGAWAEALNLVRKIKRENRIDLLKPFRGKTPLETRKNLEEFIHGVEALSSYEKNFRERIKELKLNKELEGLFTKKYKEKVEEISGLVSKKASKI